MIMHQERRQLVSAQVRREAITKFCVVRFIPTAPKTNVPTTNVYLNLLHLYLRMARFSVQVAIRCKSKTQRCNLNNVCIGHANGKLQPQCCTFNGEQS